MEKKRLFHCLYLLVGLLFIVNTSQLEAASFGDKDGEPVETEGDWTEGNRSLSDSIPEQLYWDGTNLIIENPSGRSEIHVSISIGVACAYVYLSKHGFIQGDINDILLDVDKEIVRRSSQHLVQESLFDDIEFYRNYRLNYCEACDCLLLNKISQLFLVND